MYSSSSAVSTSFLCSFFKLNGACDDARDVYAGQLIWIIIFSEVGDEFGLKLQFF
jgi:hypothetical protein